MKALPAPARTQSNRRTYSDADVRRLRFIRHARELGFEVDASGNRWLFPTSRSGHAPKSTPSRSLTWPLSTVRSRVSSCCGAKSIGCSANAHAAAFVSAELSKFLAPTQNLVIAMQASVVPSGKVSTKAARRLLARERSCGVGSQQRHLALCCRRALFHDRRATRCPHQRYVYNRSP